MKSLVRATCVAFAFCFATMTGTAASAQTESDAACQRECLQHWVDSYLVAMRGHNADPKLFAPDVKFTENGIRLPFGHEGLWYDMSGIGSYKFYVPDVETQQVAFIGTVLEKSATSTQAPGKDTLVALALRLKIRGGKITEIEQLAIRPTSTNSSSNAFPPTGEGVEAMKEPNPIFKEVIPESERPSREEMVKTANYYFAGLQRNDGKGYYPFTDDCIRFENGVDVLANAFDPETGKRGRMSCKHQFEVALKGVVSRIRDRRFVAVDRERGIVFAFAFFDHHKINWTWQLAELFKIEKGKIRRIEAVFHRAPFGINSGWSTYEQGMSEDIQSIR